MHTLENLAIVVWSIMALAFAVSILSTKTKTIRLVFVAWQNARLESVSLKSATQAVAK